MGSLNKTWRTGYTLGYVYSTLENEGGEESRMDAWNKNEWSSTIAASARTSTLDKREKKDLSIDDLSGVQF